MALPGRIEGRKSGDGQSYIIVQNGNILRSIPMHEAMADTRLIVRIKQNGWEAL